MPSPIRLTIKDVEAYRNQGSGLQTGKYVRYYCPIHGSDNQRSFSLNPETGHFKCFACRAWGYLKGGQFNGRTGISKPCKKPEGPTPLTDEFSDILLQLMLNLPDSLGQVYLEQRGIPLELAEEYCVGYAPPGEWPHFDKHGYAVRQWKHGRLVFPQTDPERHVVNLYGRAVAVGATVPKEHRHDNLPGAKGVFNTPALAQDVVYICEGCFDALSLIAAGYRNACAIIGTDGLRWEWVKGQQVVFCMDPDQGGAKWRKLAMEGILRGKKIHFLPDSFYRGYKDLNDLWGATGRLDLGEVEGGDV